MKQIIKTKFLGVIASIFFLSFFTTNASNLYWIGGTGNWSDSNHWSLTSGGTTSGVIPTSVDNVFFDANSFTGTGQQIYLDVNAYCADMNWTGVTFSPGFNGSGGQPYIYGSLTFIPNMTYLLNVPISFNSTTPGKTITTAGHNLNNAVNFNGTGGSWTLQDNLNTWGPLYLYNGTLNTNNMTLNIGSFVSNTSTSRSLVLGSSVVNVGGSMWDASGSNFTLISGTSRINLNHFGIIFQGGSQSYNELVFTDPAGGPQLHGGTSYNRVSFLGVGYFTNISGVYFGNVSVQKTATFQTGGATFGKVTLADNGQFVGSNVFDSLILTAGKTYTIESGVSQTINLSAQINGTCAQPIYISSSITNSVAFLNSATASITASYTVIKDINAVGGANFTANSSFGLGNNTGWIINAPISQNLYWVGGTGNWNDPAHWALSSGGAGGTCVPTSVDNAYFDANSFTGAGQTVTINAAAECDSMIWTGATNTPSLGGTANLNIYGSLKFISAMNNSFTGKVYFKSSLSGNTITSAGKSFTNHVVFDGVNGDWTLQDALLLNGTSGYLLLFNGFLSTNNNNVTCYTFQSNVNNSRGLSLGTSTVTVTGPATANPWYVTGSNIFIDAGTSLIKFTAADNTNMYGGAGNYYYNVLFQDATTFTGTIQDGAGFYNVTFNAFGSVYSTNANFVNKVIFTKDATIYGTNNSFGNAVFLANALINENTNFDTLFFSAGKTYTIGASKIQTINILQTNGTCTLPISILSGTSGTFASFSSPNNIAANYLSLKDIHASGSFVANNSIDLGNNTGWTINAPAPQNLYWRGGTGNWNDPAHWSFTSGGAGGACVPTRYDNVFFNAGSFTGAPKQVTINVPAYCNNINFTGVPTGGHSIIGTSDLSIYGSLTIASTISITNYTGKVYFKATTTGNTITSAGKVFNNDVYFDGVGGGWTLQDAFNTSSVMYLYAGIFNTNNKALTCNSFFTGTASIKQLSLGSSTITILGTTSNNRWDLSSNTNLSLNAGTSLIKFIATSFSSNFNAGVGLAYFNVTFQDPLNQGLLWGSGSTFNNVIFNAPSNLYGGTFKKVDFRNSGVNYLSFNMTFDSLLFGAGSTNYFSLNNTQTINRYLRTDGTVGSLTKIYPETNGTYFISMPSCTVCQNYVDIKGCTATGGAQFYAANSTNGGGNTGWNFAACPSQTLTVGPITGNANTCINSTNYIYSIPAVSGADSYTWSVPAGATILSGQGTNTIYVSFGSTGGNVSVDVTACGNTGNATRAITVNPLPTISNISVTPATCNHNDGSATATVTGGTPTYFYRWSSGDTLATADSISAGQYQLIVIDMNGCRATASATIVASDGPSISLVNTTPTSCYDGTNGTASISISGGVSPYVILWSNGANTLSATGLAAGPYDITVTDANNCIASQSVTITEPTMLTAGFVINPSACAGATGSAQANIAGGTGTYTYMWDAAASNQTTQLATALAAGVYQVIVTDANLCQTTFTATVPNTATTLASSISSVVAGDCGPNSAGSATMNVTGGAPGYIYLWSNGANTATITGVPPGNYYCTVTDASLCSSSQSVTIPSNIGNITQSLCLVTVDTATFTNKVVWEKTTTHDIQSFKIYRESNIQNVYTAIAIVPYDSLSEYTDPVANPAIHAWRYKIKAVDSCGVETPHSAAHKTIHLSQNLGLGGVINLSWDQYEGFPYYSYYIWRHDPSTGWMPLDTLSTNYTTYTDFFPPSMNSRYMVEVQPQMGCTSTRGAISTSRSNIKSPTSVGIKSEINNLKSKIRVYPNPATEMLNIELLMLNEKEATVILENMLGQVVYSVNTNQQINKINTSLFANGVYLVKVKTTSGISVQKVIIE